ncbi:MAG: undecaprenyl-diphosphate phosphatase [Synergistaceae bacterium]|jgi:undecaprenyl-diphosphatase|nr:undecaprenyl-diphosphate phosphatase [Synergistaceae bacterium]MDD3916368.1 undecaprenyl-diphosphate phosphatase [Synergistaceae bacterium]
MSEGLPAFFLGLLQGVTEFLPVSSSGHLALAKQLFSVEHASLTYDVLLHFATMLATLLYFGKDILLLLREWCSGFFSPAARCEEGWTLGWAVLAGTVVTAAIALPLKPVVERMMELPGAVGAGLLLTSLLLWRGSSIAFSLKGAGKPISLGRGFLIGLVQGVAVLPGVSRSGSTIVAGMSAGLSAPAAFRFSFLLSLPAVFGATLLEVRGLLKTAGWASSLPAGWIAGFFASFLAGFFSLVLLRRVVSAGKWRPFAVYCAFAGTLSIVLSLLG